MNTNIRFFIAFLVAFLIYGCSDEIELHKLKEKSHKLTTEINNLQGKLVKLSQQNSSLNREVESLKEDLEKPNNKLDSDNRKMLFSVLCSDNTTEQLLKVFLFDKLDIDNEDNYESNSYIKSNYFHEIYWIGNNRLNSKSWEDQYQTFLIQNFNRDSDHISKLFNNNKELLYKFLSKHIYLKSGISKYIKTLIKTYRHITAQPNYTEMLQRIWTVPKPGFSASQYKIYKPLILKEVEKEYVRSPEEVVVTSEFAEYAEVVWFHSFWVRRYKEGNMNTVYEILKEIDKHYENENK